jgi:SMI1 / KNR4 family (SUKH-1)
MHVRNDKRWGPLEEQTVVEFEARNGIQLPSEYRAFLLDHHGGVPIPSFYWVVPDDWGSGIENLYGFGDRGYRLQEHLDAREAIGISPELLIIGDDGCCNYLSIGVSGERRGQVFYIDHEYGRGDPKRERLLASSFTEFLERLSADPD